MYKLPPLNALKAFEAVARLGTFSLAADYLSVSQSAVSRQVAKLEDWFGFFLFERHGHEIKLTDKGAVYYESISKNFAQISQQTLSLMQSKVFLLKIKLPPTFAIKWLVPRLGTFHALHPKLEMQILTSHIFEDISSSDCDIVIHSMKLNSFKSGIKLFEEFLLPVCSPGLLKSSELIDNMNMLKKYTLLSSINRPNDWSTWLNAVREEEVDPTHGLKFDNAALAYQAAINGVGVMMGIYAFVSEDLKKGTLISPIPIKVETSSCYFLHLNPNKNMEQKKIIESFKTWILNEIQLIY